MHLLTDSSGVISDFLKKSEKNISAIFRIGPEIGCLPYAGFSKIRPIGQFFHRVAMSVYLSVCPLSRNFFCVDRVRIFAWTESALAWSPTNGEVLRPPPQINLTTSPKLYWSYYPHSLVHRFFFSRMRDFFSCVLNTNICSVLAYCFIRSHIMNKPFQGFEIIIILSAFDRISYSPCILKKVNEESCSST